MRKHASTVTMDTVTDVKWLEICLCKLYMTYRRWYTYCVLLSVCYRGDVFSQRVSGEYMVVCCFKVLGWLVGCNHGNAMVILAGFHGNHGCMVWHVWFFYLSLSAFKSMLSSFFFLLAMHSCLDWHVVCHRGDICLVACFLFLKSQKTCGRCILRMWLKSVICSDPYQVTDVTVLGKLRISHWANNAWLNLFSSRLFWAKVWMKAMNQVPTWRKLEKQNTSPTES